MVAHTGYMGLSASCNIFTSLSYTCAHIHTYLNNSLLLMTFDEWYLLFFFLTPEPLSVKSSFYFLGGPQVLIRIQVYQLCGAHIMLTEAYMESGTCHCHSMTSSGSRVVALQWWERFKLYRVFCLSPASAYSMPSEYVIYCVYVSSVMCFGSKASLRLD